MSHVYCLDRRAEGLAYHEQAAKAADFDLAVYASKVTFLQGTLGEPRFGIQDDQAWETIQTDIGVVLHLAWPVNYNHNLALSEFRSSLKGLTKLFGFAAEHPMRPAVMYVSST